MPGYADLFPPPPGPNQVFVCQYNSDDFPNFKKELRLDRNATDRLITAGLTLEDVYSIIEQMNIMIEYYNPCKTCYWIMMCFSCGICFCPTFYCGMKQQDNVRASIRKKQKRAAKSTVVPTTPTNIWSKLKYLNITVEYYKGGKHGGPAGGLMFSLNNYS